VILASEWRYTLTFQGQAIEIEEGVSVIGRSRACCLQIPEASVSRQHLRITTAADALVVEDLGSSNGSFLNGEVIESRTSVRDGDRLELGDAELRVSITAREATAAPPPAAPAFGEATMLLQNQSVDLARQVEQASNELKTSTGTAAAHRDAGSAEATGQVATRAAAEARQLATIAIDPAQLLEDAASSEPLPGEAETVNAAGWEGFAAFESVPTPPPSAAAPSAPAPRPAPLPAAGLGLRALAWVADGVGIALLAAMLWLGLGFNRDPQGWQAATLIALACAALAILIGWSLVGTTPGKRLLGLYVCTRHGQPGIGWLRAAIRCTGWILSLLTFGIGFLLAAGADHRALHDRMAGTYVGRRARGSMKR